MSCFAGQAQRLLDAAQMAASRGEPCSGITILIRQDGGIHMLADSDWPLDSLVLEHGARTAYRVSERNGSVRVEGREGLKKCVLESPGPRKIAQMLLGVL